MNTVAVPSGPMAVYTGRSSNWPMVVGFAVLGIALLAGAASSDVSVELVITCAVVVFGVVANIVTASSVRTTAGPNGVVIRWGTVGWPRLRYELDSIVNAEVVDVPWLHVSAGFWWTPRSTYCTVMGGPALRLQLTNGRRVTVTVPAPSDAVAAIERAQR